MCFLGFDIIPRILEANDLLFIQNEIKIEHVPDFLHAKMENEA